MPSSPCLPVIFRDQTPSQKTPSRLSYLLKFITGHPGGDHVVLGQARSLSWLWMVGGVTTSAGPCPCHGCSRHRGAPDLGTAGRMTSQASAVGEPTSRSGCHRSPGRWADGPGLGCMLTGDGWVTLPATLTGLGPQSHPGAHGQPLWVEVRAGRVPSVQGSTWGSQPWWPGSFQN